MLQQAVGAVVLLDPRPADRDHRDQLVRAGERVELEQVSLLCRQEIQALRQPHGNLGLRQLYRRERGAFGVRVLEEPPRARCRVGQGRHVGGLHVGDRRIEQQGRRTRRILRFDLAGLADQHRLTRESPVSIFTSPWRCDVAPTARVGRGVERAAEQLPGAVEVPCEQRAPPGCEQPDAPALRRDGQPRRLVERSLRMRHRAALHRVLADALERPGDVFVGSSCRRGEAEDATVDRSQAAEGRSEGSVCPASLRRRRGVVRRQSGPADDGRRRGRR